jgi:DNA polymerase-1
MFIHMPRLREVMFEALRQDDLLTIAEIEFGCTRVVSNMEFIGFPVNVEMYEKVIESVTERRDKRHEELQQLLTSGEDEAVIQTGLFGDDTVVNSKRINVNSWQQLIPAFAKIGIDLPKTDKRTVARLVTDHPELQYLTRYRELETLLKNFGRKNINLIDPRTGRLHPTFWQILTETGRFSSSNPNLQQQPRLPEFRDCFRPTDPDRCFLIYDYSGIELRILAQISQEQVMIDAFNNGKDLHSITAKSAFKLTVFG